MYSTISTHMLFWCHCRFLWHFCIFVIVWLMLTYILERIFWPHRFQFYVITRGWYAHQKVRLDELNWEKWAWEIDVGRYSVSLTKQLQNMWYCPWQKCPPPAPSLPPNLKEKWISNCSLNNAPSASVYQLNCAFGEGPLLWCWLRLSNSTEFRSQHMHYIPEKPR